MPLVKIHKSYRTTVSLCDEDLIGRKLSEGLRELDLTGEFFKGKKTSDEEILEILRDMALEDATFNIVGEKSCELAKEAGVISDEGIFKIEGVLVALALL